MNWLILPFRRCVDFQGRSRRMEYFSFHVALGCLLGVCAGVVLVLEPSLSTATLQVCIGIMSLMVICALLPAVSLEVRRFHDLGLSGWYTLLNLIPIIGRPIALLCLFRKGTVGPNRFGKDPIE